MITEYRALRASVLKIWFKSGCTPDPVDDITRFNESIDQSIAESVSRYTLQTKRSTDLFIGILGHDIRNPLGTIVMSAEILARSQAPQKVVTTIINSAVRINGLIEQVLDFTRAQAHGSMPIQRQPGNLGDQLVKVLHESQVRYPHRQFEFKRSGTFDGNWDEGRMGQLLSNLLGNAVRYGEPTGVVTLTLWSDEHNAYFSVHNLGTPIREHDLVRIFEPLARGLGVEGAEQRSEPVGLGLGLYICREIVRSHGGALTVTSSTEAGTTFTVRLPRFALVAR
ncbi:MAG: HAMP domain-containing histidine kinase [Ramlibacter sp.]|nr:HAMP domain-containing histidine kinase [Ramlibacter sp.]